MKVKDYINDNDDDLMSVITRNGIVSYSGFLGNIPEEFRNAKVLHSSTCADSVNPRRIGILYLNI